VGHGLKHKWLLLVLGFCFSSCFSSSNLGSGDPEPENDVGTIVTLPTGSSIKFIPNFAELFPETSLGSELDELKPVPEPAMGGYSMNSTNPFFLWNRIILGDNFVLLREYRSNLLAFGQLLTEAFSTTTLENIKQSSVSVTLPAFTLIETGSTAWEVTASAESTNENFIRFHIANKDTGVEVATYTVYVDEENNPIKGLFAYVRPELLTEELSETGTRYLALSFDSTNTLGKQMMMRMDRYNHEINRYFVNQVYYDAFAESGQRVDEFVEIVTPSPARKIAKTAMRLTYDNTGEICMASMDYESDPIAKITYGFQGPAGPSPDTMSVNQCHPATPIRGNTTITEDMLPMRYLDTEPYGGDAAALYGNGANQETWMTLTPDTISQWLNPE